MENVTFTNVLNTVMSNFDFNFIIIVNVLTYCIINILDKLNGEKVLSLWQKRLVLLLSIIIISSSYCFVGYKEYIILINSAVITPVFWSWILKPICKKLDIDYKQIDDALNCDCNDADN